MDNSGEADCIVQFLLRTCTHTHVNINQRQMNNRVMRSEITCSRSYFCCSILFLSSSSTWLIWMKRSFCNTTHPQDVFRDSPSDKPVGYSFSAAPPILFIHNTNITSAVSESHLTRGGAQQQNTSRGALWVINILTFSFSTVSIWSPLGNLQDRNSFHKHRLKSTVLKPTKSITN